MNIFHVITIGQLGPPDEVLYNCIAISFLRASMIWIIGEYAERIDNADELLESFLDGFQDENTQVQLQLLTAIVKLFLKRPTDTQGLVQQVLSLATQVRRQST